MSRAAMLAVQYISDTPPIWKTILTKSILSYLKYHCVNFSVVLTLVTQHSEGCLPVPKQLYLVCINKIQGN